MSDGIERARRDEERDQLEDRLKSDLEGKEFEISQVQAQLIAATPGRTKELLAQLKALDHERWTIKKQLDAMDRGVESVVDDLGHEPGRSVTLPESPRTARTAALAAGGLIIAGLFVATALPRLIAGGNVPAATSTAPLATTAAAAPTPAATAQGPMLPTAAAAGYHCSGGAIKIFDNWNGAGVQSGGTPVTFSTSGKPYCLAMIATYHWNSGKGVLPGSITIAAASGTATLQAVGTNGQNNVADANWVASFPPGTEPLINGTYTCSDSDPSTWAQNDGSSHQGFCRVWVTEATR